MMQSCQKCGVLLSMPTDSCQDCGHPVSGTIFPSGSFPPPPRTQPRPEGADFEVPDGLSGTVPPSDYPMSADESERVDRLLSLIAAQSHFEERYEVRSELARGGMGQVFQAWDRILRREVAIKMMHNQHGGVGHTPAVRGQFLKEARVGGRLLHPNILSVFDLGVNKAGQIYYTMRLVDGASFQHCLDAVDRGVVTGLVSYPLRRIVESLVGACRGVDYAHQQGILHLDIKPHNILVSGFYEVFVIDWGLARVDEADDTEELVDLYRESRRTQDTSSSTGAFGDRVVGTPAYMAPEQTRGTVSIFDPTTDLYGLGGVLHFILYGKPPNQGKNVHEMFYSSTQPKTRGRLRAGILPRGQRVRTEARAAVDALEAICMKALAPEQDRRYPSVEAMIVELNEWLHSTPKPPLGF